MNKKAAITRELNAKHVKVLEGLLKLPENRECADCKSKAPRWASINLGIFICLQCSGIHRSFGVHISKVRSATLDTWLPEQVAYMQSMGNEKSNAYWEAELPPHYDRGRIENFMRAKYVERKWVPREGKVKSPPRSKEELASAHSSRSGSGDSIAKSNDKQHKERKDCSRGEKHVVDLSGKSSYGSGQVRKDCADNENQLQHQVVPDPGPNDSLQKAEPAVSKVRSSAPKPVVPSPKVDYATELFRTLCMDDSSENDSSPSSVMSSWVDFESEEEASLQEGKIVPNSSSSKVHPEPIIAVKTDLVHGTKGHPPEHQKNVIKDKKNDQENYLSPSSDMSAWVDFDSDGEASIQEGIIVPKSSSSKVHPEPKIEHIQTDLVPVTNRHLQEHQKNVTNDKQSHLEKASASSIHLERLSMLAEGGSSLAYSTEISHYKSQNCHSNHQLDVKSGRQPSINGNCVNHTTATQITMQNIHQANFAANTASRTMSSLNRPAVPINSVSTKPGRRPSAALPVSGYDYDFSFLTRGMLSKR